MEKTKPHIIPSVYLAHYLDEFEEMIKSYGVSKRTVDKGTYLTQYGVINNTAHFIKKGIIHLSLGHDKGKKSLNMFGAGTVFPIGVEIHEFRVEYEMIIQALTDVECYEIPYPTLKKMAMEHGDFAGELLRENCDFIGYMFFDSINQTFEPMSEKIPLSQTELASIAGASHSQMERAIQILKKEEILQTSRRQIEIINSEKLLEYCTLGMRTSI